MNGLDGLAACVGNWCGSNTLQDPNSGRPEESPSTLAVTPVLGGRFVRLDYTWFYQGKPQEGSLLVGFEPRSGAVSGHWIDTWHMGRKAMACVGGPPAAGMISITGSYAAPTGPDWCWRIVVTSDGDTLRVTHTNIAPDGKEEPAAQGVYSRS
jgi:hypothetical protein